VASDPYFGKGNNVGTINYQNVISNATQAYNTTLAGYRAQLAQQQQQQAGVIQGYNALQANVLQGLQGGSAADQQAIRDQYAAQSGKQQMSMIGRGLGNTTIMDSMQRGLNLDEAKAQTDRANKFAGLAAGYQSQIGLAGLGYAGSALQHNLDFAGQGLQYSGQGAQGLGQLSLGFAGLENQAEQARLQRLSGGGGGISSYSGDAAGKGAGPGGSPPGTYHEPYHAPDPWIALNQPGQGRTQPMTYGGAWGGAGRGFDQTDEWAYQNLGTPGGGGSAPYGYGDGATAGAAPGGMTSAYGQGWDEGTGE
jgi:hypothetical protein